MYVQHNGVAMGAPLAPVMADIFMVHLETTLMDSLMQQGVCEWYRYVDDTFVLVNSDTDVVNILAIFNDFHASIKGRGETARYARRLAVKARSQNGPAQR